METDGDLPVDALLLDAKLSAPPVREGSVSRADLIERARQSGCPVVGVTAAAGYGKSTLLAQWAAAEDRRVGWVSLDRFDDDPSALLILLASAYARISPDHGELVADMRGAGVSALGRAAPRLASVLRTSPDPFVLLLDDLHELRSLACHDALGVVVAGIPSGSQVVTASRSEQPHLARLRVSGDAVELVADDLALDPSGIEQVFADVSVAMTSEQAAMVSARTEGWPAGVYLAATIARAAGGQDFTISGDDRDVADYLYRESLLQLSEESRLFLRRTAVLDQMCAPLCDALLGGSDSQEHLRALEASSLFLIPLDRRREWFRYHALFREFLLSELRRVEPDLVEKLHLRAADWYESEGSPGKAVDHLLSTSERDRCVQLVTQLVLPTYQSGHVATVERWLELLGPNAIECYPPLAVLAGWITALTGRAAEAERWGAIADAATFDAVPLDGSASFESARAMLRTLLCAGGPDRMLSDASFAVEAEPPWSPWLDTAMYLCAEACLLVGDATRAAELFAAAAEMAATRPTESLEFEAQLALLAMDSGRWPDATQHVQTALTMIEERRLHDYATSALAFAAAARLAVHRGDLERAQRHLTQAMRARPVCTSAMPFIAVRVRLQLARLYLSTGDHTSARHLMREIDDLLRVRPDLGTLVDQVADLRTALAAAPTASSGGPPLTPAELRLLPYLQTHLTIREIGERLFVSRNTVNSQISSVYRKLEVSTRNEAVQEAMSRGLLGG